MDKPTSDKDVIKELGEAIKKMPQEEYDKMVAEIDAMGLGGPTVDEYFDAISGNPHKIEMLNAELTGVKETLHKVARQKDHLVSELTRLKEENERLKAERQKVVEYCTRPEIYSELESAAYREILSLLEEKP